MLKSDLSVLCIAVLTFASVSLSHAQESQNPMSQIAEGVYHFWAMGYSSLVVAGKNGVLIVDPAFRARAEMLRNEIQKISDQPVTKVVLTHEHYDHVGGSEVFPQAEVICQRACEQMFKLDVMGMAPKKVHQTFDDKLSIDLGSHQVELYHVAPGDGRAAAILHLPKENIVASADMYGSRSFTNSSFIQDSSHLGIRKNLAKLIDMKPIYAVNTHSPGNSVKALKESAEMYEDLYEAVKAALDKAITDKGLSGAWETLFTLPSQLKLEKYKNWKDYDKFFSFYVQRMTLGILHGE